jgi:hypothetical protein
MAAAAGAQQQGAADLRLNLLAGQKHRQYDRRDHVPAATKVATDWHLELRDRIRRGEHLHGRSFADMAEAFIAPGRTYLEDVAGDWG